MSVFDEKVAKEMDMEIIKVVLQDLDSWADYRHVLLAQYPDLEGVAFPTYILVDSATALDPEIKGVVRGGMDKGAFRRALQALVT